MNTLMMNPARDADELLDAPVGACLVGASGVYWCAAPDLIGATVSGTLDDAMARDLTLLFELIAHGRLAARRHVLFDARALTRVDSDALIALFEHARARRPAWYPRLQQMAVVLPDGVPGILLSGALSSLAACAQLRVVHDADAAIAMLDHPGARAAHDLAAAHAHRTEHGSPLVARLRAELARDLVGASVERCAVALGLSVRSLQRHLGRHATSFSDELRRARVAAARDLLEHSDSKIEAIAVRLGFGNASRLTATLRRELAVTASELRDRARGAGAARPPVQEGWS